MANIFAEGFAQYANGGNFGNNGIWNTVLAATNSRLLIGSDAFGKFLQYDGQSIGSNSGQYSLVAVTVGEPLYAGYAVTYSGFSDTTRSCRVGGFIAGASGLLVVAAEANTGRLEIRRAPSEGATNTTQVFLSANQVFFSGVRAYVEIYFENDTITVRVNGVVIANAVSVTTIGALSYFALGIKPTATGTAGVSNTFSATEFKDVYINDDTGPAPNNGFLGEISVFTLFPNADDTPADWTVVGASDGFEALSNVPPDLGEYIESATPGDVSAFDLETLTGAYQIFNVRAVFYGDKSASGTCDVRFNMVQNSAVGNGAGFSLVENTPQYFVDNFPLDPDSGTAWNPLTFDPIMQIERTA